MLENVRLVIWDLDETFWKGTLSEGGIEYVERNHNMVSELARRGIVSSICSKNELSCVRSLLEERGIWSYFVMPSINWEAKGPRIAALIESFMLRPATVLFIDDKPSNLSEARHYVPELQTATPDILEGLLDSPFCKGKDDHEMTRLAHYRLLEKRHEKQAAVRDGGGSNEDFLRASAIRVRLDFDVAGQIDRAVELVTRTNQLNFTKKTLPDDPQAARDTMLALLKRYDVQAALVHASDRYGSYGIVGFYAVQNVAGRSDLVHFCFSCRTLGMGIETWIYRKIGRPWIPMVGEVVCDPRDESLAADWIAWETAVEEPTERARQLLIDRFIIRGGCNGLSIAHYFHALARSVICEVNTNRNGMPVRLEHSCITVQALTGISAQALDAVRALGYKREDFETRLFDEAAERRLVVLDFWTDSEIAVYRHRSLGFSIPFTLPYHFPVKPDQDARGLSADFVAARLQPGTAIFEALQSLRTHYEYQGLLTEDACKANMRLMLANIAPTSRVYVLTANETWRNPGNGVLHRYPAHASLNRWTAEVCAEFPGVTTLDVRRFFNSESDAETVNHYDRLVYYRIFETIRAAVD